MEKSRILELLGSVSMAVVNNLVARDKGIGSNVSLLSISAINSLYGLRRTIIGENIDLVLKDKEYSLNPSSFLNTITPEDFSNKNFGDIPESIANIVESELLQVRDVIIPEITTLVDSFTAKASQYLDTTESSSLFKVEFFRYSNLLKILASTELEGHYEDAAVDLSGISFVYPIITDYNVLKANIKLNNAVVDAAIDDVLSTRTPKYWVDRYNAIFGNIGINNEALSKLTLDKVRYVDDLIFCFLVARSYSNGAVDVGIIEGDAETYKRVTGLLVSHFRQVLARVVSYINNTSETLFDFDNDNDTIIVRKAAMGDLDIDTIIGGAILGISKTEDIIANRDACREQCMKAIDLSNIEKRNRYNDNVRNIYMDIALDYLIEKNTNVDEENPVENDSVLFVGNLMSFPDARRAVSNIVYGLGNDTLINPYNVFKALALTYKYPDTNASYIMKRMSFYLASLDKKDDVYKDVAEYVGLEMVAKYLVNAHIIIES